MTTEAGCGSVVRMPPGTLVRRSADAIHWRTNLAVVLGVAAAVAVLGRRAPRRRLGARQPARHRARPARADGHASSARRGFFREALADDLRGRPPARRGGADDRRERVRHARSDRTAGVERARLRRGRAFLVVPRRCPAADGVYLSPALAAELGAQRGRRAADARAEAVGDSRRVVVRPQGGHRPHAAAAGRPACSRASVSASSRCSRSRPRSARSSRRCRASSAISAVPARVNTVLLSGRQLRRRGRWRRLQLDDLGVRVSASGRRLGGAVVESGSGIVARGARSRGDRRAAERVARCSAVPVFTYLANAIRNGDRGSRTRSSRRPTWRC